MKRVIQVVAVFIEIFFIAFALMTFEPVFAVLSIGFISGLNGAIFFRAEKIALFFPRKFRYWYRTSPSPVVIPTPTPRHYSRQPRNNPSRWFSWFSSDQSSPRNPTYSDNVHFGEGNRPPPPTNIYISSNPPSGNGHRVRFGQGNRPQHTPTNVYRPSNPPSGNTQRVRFGQGNNEKANRSRRFG